MAVFKCKMCGGALEIQNSETIAVCEYCGTKQTVPTSKDENLQGLYNRANTLRIKSEFDKAEQLYEKILQSDGAQAEAYWGLILCKYGIEYVEDPKTFKRMPTCHRASFDSIIADEDYKSAVQYADASQREIYEQEAKEIDRIQKEIIELSAKEEPYDVFICYKETDENGKRTQDSAIANDIYYQLTTEGFKVFYAAITLEDKLGSAYEPCIFAALNSAKVMLAIGTKPEYFNAVWVKNEWSRYLKIIKKDRSKLLIPCYKDMDAYELPEEFAHLQAQDMGKIGFINDIVRGIKKVVDARPPKSTVVKETVVSSGNANISPLLKRAFMFLEDGDWERADDFCEQVLNIDPECAQAYLGKLMAELKVKTKEELKNCADVFDDKNNYQKTIRFANDNLRAELNGYIESINTRNENARLEGRYGRAKSAMASANSEFEYKEAADLFKSIGGYMDADILAQECYDKAEIKRKDLILFNGKAKMLEGFLPPNYQEALKLFESISGWKDADEQIIACQKKIEELKAKEEAERLERERKAEINRITQEKREKRNKIITAIVTPIVAVGLIFVIVLETVIIPNQKYNDAIALMDAGKYKDAIAAFAALNGYKDSVDKIKQCDDKILSIKYNDAITLMNSKKYVEAIAAFDALNGYKDSLTKIADCCVYLYGKEAYEKLGVIKPGSHINFGQYEQDNRDLTGWEIIEWRVLDIKDGKAFVVSEYALDCQEYDTTDTTWEKSAIRKWLNNDFINAAFTKQEQTAIHRATVSAEKRPEHLTNAGNNTQDKIFLLSVNEAKKYFSSKTDRQCEATPYARSSNDYALFESNGKCLWWLRSTGEEQDYAAFVFTTGSIGHNGRYVGFQQCAVRPAMWIDLSKVK